MRNTSNVSGTNVKNRYIPGMQARSYRSLAGGLADEMMGFIRPSEPRKCSPPFKMIIIDKSGAVVFECKVSKDGKVQRCGLARRVQDSHFPATALLTDSSFVTRTFLIERDAQ